MKNLRMFEIKFIGPSNTRGSRIKITDLRFKKSVIISKSYNFNGITDQCESFFKNIGIVIVSRAWCEKTGVNYFLTDNFETQIKGDLK